MRNSMRGWRIFEMCKPKECGQDARGPLKRRFCTFRRCAYAGRLQKKLLAARVPLTRILDTLPTAAPDLAPKNRPPEKAIS